MKVLKNKFVNIDNSDVESVLNALNRKKLSGTAAIVREYEEDLAPFFQSKFALACNSGTGAIHLALIALNVTSGDEVIVPPTAPTMTVLPIVALRAKLVFADITSPNNFGFSIEDLRKKITSRTKAIITVPMWGYPIEMDDVVEIGQSKNIPIVEDCSQAHGTKTNQKYLGTYGDVGIFSTHDRKLVCTGEGAYILTNNAELNERMQEIRCFGRVIREKPELEKYKGQFGVQFGLNFKINALGAALGRTQLAKLNDKIKARTKNANYLKKGLSGIRWIEEIPVRINDFPNYYSLVLHVHPELNSAVPIAEYLSERNIISDTYDYNYQPLYKMPLFKSDDVCPNAEMLCKSIITLPTHEGLKLEELDYMIAAITDYASRV